MPPLAGLGRSAGQGRSVVRLRGQVGMTTTLLFGRASTPDGAGTQPASHGGYAGWWRFLTGSLLVFSALSAIGGGVELVYFRAGTSPFLPPPSVLAYTPFDDFLVPGLLLAGWVGGTSLVAAVLTWRRSAWAVDAALLAAGSLTLWIVAEVGMMRQLHWLHVVYGGLGLCLLTLSAFGALHWHLARPRFVGIVTLAESLGFVAPALIGIFAQQWQLAAPLSALSLVCAGAIEGFLLGAGQAWALPIRVDRVRFSLFTAGGAAVAWGLAMTVSVVAGNPQVSAVNVGLLAVVCALLGLAALSGAQWLVLRRHAVNAVVYARWTVVAWLLALPASFAAGPFVDEQTPVASLIALFGCAGVLMAYLMAVLTWQGARRLVCRPPMQSA